MTDNTSKGGQSFKPQNSKSDLSACQYRKGLILFRVFSISLSLFPLPAFLILTLSVSTPGNLCSHSLTLSPWNGWVSHGSSLTRENSAGQKWLRWHRCSSSVRGSTSLLFSCKSEASWEFVVYPPQCDTHKLHYPNGCRSILPVKVISIYSNKA